MQGKKREGDAKQCEKREKNREEERKRYTREMHGLLMYVCYNILWCVCGGEAAMGDVTVP